ncbi:MAG: 50S ribosomal protein L4 [Deltaproteobacteria bacterium]|nr:50S ribosomal protein L4 [Deltaproteobacteria bacterium]
MAEKKAKKAKPAAGVKAVKGAGLGEKIAAAKPRKGVIHQVVTAQLASRRRGTHKTKRRGEVRGGGRKPYKQKGTGRARPGSTRSPVWVGGGAAFGPLPRSYEKRVNRQEAKLALAGVLASKQQDGKLVVVESVPLPEVKTRHVQAVIGELGLAGTVLFVTAELDGKLTLAARNIPGVKVLPVAGLNPYDVLKYEHLVIVQDALEGVEKRAAA